MNEQQQQSNNPLDDFSVTLEYTVKEINAILQVLGKLPFIDAIGAINSIQILLPTYPSTASNACRAFA